MLDVITTLAIRGMTCNGCVKHVDRALRAVPGVTAVQVDLAKHEARITHEPGRPDTAGMIEAVRAAGYEAATDDVAG